MCTSKRKQGIQNASLLYHFNAILDTSILNATLARINTDPAWSGVPAPRTLCRPA